MILTGTTRPGGSDTQIQFNNAGVFGASASLVWDGSGLVLTQDLDGFTPILASCANGTGFSGPLFYARLSGGTHASKTVPAANSDVVGFIGEAWNGSAFENVGEFFLKTSTNVPVGSVIPSYWKYGVWADNGDACYAYIGGSTFPYFWMENATTGTNAVIGLTANAEFSLLDSSMSGYSDLKLKNLTAAGLTLNGHAVTLTGALTRVGAHALTLTTTGPTNVTLPTTGTLATTGGSDTQIQFNSAGVLGGSTNLTWNGTSLGVGRSSWISQVAGAFGSGNEQMTLWKLTPPSGSVANAPWEHVVGGSTFSGVWDSVSYCGYNASRGASPAEPTLRQVIEASYNVVSRVDMEMYWEFLSADGSVGWRPFMITVNRASPYDSTTTITGRNAVNIVGATSQLDVYLRGSSSSYGVQVTEQGDNYLGVSVGDANSGPGVKRYGVNFGNSNYRGGVLVQGGTAGAGASTEAYKYSWSVVTNAKLRHRIGDDGKISWFYNTAANFGVGAQSDYERLALNLASGLATFAGESAGTGAANIGIAFTPKGAGAISHNGAVVITEPVGSSGLTITGATQTASFPALNITQTWNNAGVTFTGMKLNVTSTASAAASMLMDLQLGGTSVLAVTKTGIIAAGTSILTPNHGGAGRWLFGDTSAAGGVFINRSSNEFDINASMALGWSSNSAGSNAADVKLFRDAAAILALRNGTNAQAFRLYNTYTDASNYEMGGMAWTSNELNIGVFAPAGTGVTRNLNLHTRGGTIYMYHAGTTYWSFNLGVGARSLQPGATNSYDIGNSSFRVRSLYLGTSLIFSAGDIETDTTTGTKIGTSTSQKIGFYNATPIVQGASVADATGGAIIDAEARTAINALISRIEALGLIATV